MIKGYYEEKRKPKETPTGHSGLPRRKGTGTTTIFQEMHVVLKGKFSSGREGALASKFNYDFK